MGKTLLGASILLHPGESLPTVTPREMEVLLALLGAEQRESLSVACCRHSLSSEAGSSDVCRAAGLTWSRELRDRSLARAQRVIACFQRG